MKLANKELKEYFDMMKLPLLVVIAVMFFSFVIGLIPLIGGLFNVFTGGIRWLLFVAAAGYVGWVAVKNYKAEIVHTVIAGLIFGVITGVFGAVFGFLRIMLSAFTTAASGNLIGAGIAGGFGMVFSVIGLIFAVFIGAGLGVVCSLIGGLIAKN